MDINRFQNAIRLERFHGLNDGGEDYRSPLIQSLDGAPILPTGYFQRRIDKTKRPTSISVEGEKEKVGELSWDVCWVEHTRILLAS